MSDIPNKTYTEVAADFASGKPVTLVRLCCEKEDCNIKIWNTVFEIIRLIDSAPGKPKEWGTQESLDFTMKVLTPELLLQNDYINENTPTWDALETACQAAGLLLGLGYEGAMAIAPSDRVQVYQKKVN